MKLMRTGIALGVAALALAGCSVFGGGGDNKPKTPTIGERIPILTSESSAELDPSHAYVADLHPPATDNEEWSHTGGNAAKAMEHLGLGNALAKAWTAEIDGTTKFVRLASSPVVGEGKVFVVDTYARLHAFDLQTGRKLWVSQVGAPDDVKGGISLWTGEMTGNRGSLFGGGASYEAGVVYATNGLGDAAAFSAADGKQLWKVRPGGPLRGAPTVGIGQIFVMSQDNQLFALNATNGELIWNEAAALETSGVFGVAAPALAQGTVVAGFSSGELSAYRYENGRALWGDTLSRTSISTTVASLSDIDASPVSDRGRVFAIGQGGRMVSLELVTGQRLWEVNVAGISTPWVAGEWVFVVDDQARLLCLARSTGKVRWVSKLPRWKNEKKKSGAIVWTSPVLAGDRLILASSEGDLVNVDPTTGAIQSQTEAGDSVSLPLVVAGRTLLVLSSDGRLTAWR